MPSLWLFRLARRHAQLDQRRQRVAVLTGKLAAVNESADGTKENGAGFGLAAEDDLDYPSACRIDSDPRYRGGEITRQIRNRPQLLADLFALRIKRRLKQILWISLNDRQQQTLKVFRFDAAAVAEFR